VQRSVSWTRQSIEKSDPQRDGCEPAPRVGVKFLDFTDDGYLRRPALRRFDEFDQSSDAPARFGVLHRI